MEDAFEYFRRSELEVGYQIIKAIRLQGFGLLSKTQECVLNWNSIMRSVTAFAMYIAVVGAYLVGISPLWFALSVAIILSLGLWAHSVDLYSTQHKSTSHHSALSSLVPSLSESMDQLHVLQTEINELQAQFAIDTGPSIDFNTPRGAAS